MIETKRRPLGSAMALFFAFFGFLPSAYAQQEKILAQAFRLARQVRSFERMQEVEVLAAELSIAKNIQSGSKGEVLLPNEGALAGASWVAVVGTAGNRLATRGDAPVDIGRRDATQKALLSLPCNDLIASPSGPLYIAAAPIELSGKVIGALVVAWPEANQLKDFAKSTCDCQALLMSGNTILAGEGLPAEEAAALLPKFQATQSGDIQTTLMPHQKKLAAYFPLSGELSDISYLLLFDTKESVVYSPEEEAAPRSPLMPMLVLASTLLLGGVLVLVLHASRREQTLFDEAALRLQIPALYKDFLDTKVRCGESIEAVTLEHFSLKVREICAIFAKTYNQPKLKISVSTKNGRTQLVVVPDA
jgi:hypothetical protein